MAAKMAWKSVGKAIVAEVKIEETGVPIPPVTPPVEGLKEMEDFVKEHEKLKSLIKQAGGCISIEDLMTQSDLTEERLELHVELFAENDYVAKVVKEAICNRDAIKDLSTRLGGEE